jgi:hypothetical protein
VSCTGTGVNGSAEALLATVDSIEHTLATNRTVPLSSVEAKALATAVAAGLVIDGVRLEVRSG